MIWYEESPDFTKSSAFSLVSITTDISENIRIMKRVVEMNFFNMYQSSIFINCRDEFAANAGKCSVKTIPSVRTAT
jgi:hypothetical protein